MQELSFSYRAKQEIIERINSRDKADACLMGVLLCANKLGTDEISVLTENAMLRDFFVLNVGRILGCDDGVTVGEIQRRGSAVLYDLSITRAQDRLFILDYFQLDESRGMSRDDLPKEKYVETWFLLVGMVCGRHFPCVRQRAQPRKEISHGVRYADAGALQLAGASAYRQLRDNPEAR